VVPLTFYRIILFAHKFFSSASLFAFFPRAYNSGKNPLLDSKNPVIPKDFTP
jgi:hypothetical protein